MRYVVSVLCMVGWLLAVFVEQIQGHTIQYQVAEGRAGVLTAYTPIANPVRFAGVKVYAPGNDSLEYANGRTDMEGRFAFVPNCPGTWKVMLHMDTSHGPHSVAAEFEITEDLRVPVQGRAFTLVGRVAIGVGLILGATGWVAYWAQRSHSKQAQQTCS